ncbi:hypothetical protein A2V82_08560 [candidate division KSB1 bacterium RBG_16_48_16]|nr:MAG: hypothetical protein A2V82_08560 [candidate division KSB1 bacterium RBG_16_48_16]
MSKSIKQKGLCPNQKQLEMLCLDVGLNEEERKRTQMHLQQCESCSAKVKDFDSFYSVLIQEITRPVTNKVLDFAKTLSRSDVIYGLIACEPLPEGNNGKGHAYKARLIFSANGYGGEKKLADFSIKDLNKLEINIRWMTDSQYDSTLLYLLTQGTEDYKDWKLHIPGVSEQVRFNSAGAAVIPNINLTKLDNKILYFDSEANESEEENRLVRLAKAVFPATCQ